MRILLSLLVFSLVTLSVCKLQSDFDECAAKENACPDADRMLCINTLQSYKCKCEIGSEFDIKLGKCIDQNECILGTHTCNKNAYCKNSSPGYQCFCNRGYYGDGNVCHDINECKTGQADCGSDRRVECVNTVGSYNCSCSIGYDFKPLKQKCEDFDECKGQVTCSTGMCDNTPGSYRCRACAQGYWKEAWVCNDFDECKYGKYSCRDDETCKNTIGSYRCICKDGYKMNDSVCKDIDECKIVACPKNNKCINTDGSYRCVCNPGYRMLENTDSKMCVPVLVQSHHSGRTSTLLPTVISHLIATMTTVVITTATV